jgi:hypothetical protein
MKSRALGKRRKGAMKRLEEEFDTDPTVQSVLEGTPQTGIEEILSEKISDKPVVSLSYSWDGDYIAAASDKVEVFTVEYETRKLGEARPYFSGQHEYYGVSFGPDYRLAVVAVNDEAHLIITQTAQINLKEINYVTDREFYTGVSCSPDEKHIAVVEQHGTGMPDREITVFAVDYKNSIIREVAGTALLGNGPTGIDFDNEGRQLLWAGSSSMLQVLAMESGELETKLDKDMGKRIIEAKWNPRKYSEWSRMAVLFENQVLFYEVNREVPDEDVDLSLTQIMDSVLSLKQLPQKIEVSGSSIAYCPDGQEIAVGCSDGMLRIYKL